VLPLPERFLIRGREGRGRSESDVVAAAAAAAAPPPDVDDADDAVSELDDVDVVVLRAVCAIAGRNFGRLGRYFLTDWIPG
jgi:hypothetical protein